MDNVDIGKDQLVPVRKVNVNGWRFHAGIYNEDRTPAGDLHVGRDYLAKVGRGYVRVRCTGVRNEIMYPVSVDAQPSTEQTEDQGLRVAVARAELKILEHYAQ